MFRSPQRQSSGSASLTKRYVFLFARRVNFFHGKRVEVCHSVERVALRPARRHILVDLGDRGAWIRDAKQYILERICHAHSTVKVEELLWPLTGSGRWGAAVSPGRREEGEERFCQSHTHLGKILTTVRLKVFDHSLPNVEHESVGMAALHFRHRATRSVYSQIAYAIPLSF